MKSSLLVKLMLSAVFTVAAQTTLSADQPPPSIEQKQVQDDIKRYTPAIEKVPTFPDNEYFKERSDTLDDVILHSNKGAYTVVPEPPTIAHETVHGINNFMQQKLRSNPQYQNIFSHTDKNGFIYKKNAIMALYTGNGNSMIIKSPRGYTIPDIGHLVPTSLRGESSFHYMMRNDKDPYSGAPLVNLENIFNESSAFLMGGRTAIELHDGPIMQSLASEKRDYFNVPAHFIGYLLTIGAEIERAEAQNPGSVFETEKDKEQVYAAIQILSEGLAEVYIRSTDYERYPLFNLNKENYMEKLAKNSDAQKLRNFAARVYGKDWLSTHITHIQTNPSISQNPSPDKLTH